MYLENDGTGRPFPSRLNDQTQLQKTRQRFLYRERGQNGLPLANTIKSNLHKHEFIPIVCKKQEKAKNLNNEFTTEVGLYEDDYNLKRLKDFKDHEESK